MIWDNKIMIQIGIIVFNLPAIEYFVGIRAKTINKNRPVNTKGFFVEKTKKLTDRRRIILKTAIILLIIQAAEF